MPRTSVVDTESVRESSAFAPRLEIEKNAKKRVVVLADDLLTEYVVRGSEDGKFKGYFLCPDGEIPYASVPHNLTVEKVERRHVLRVGEYTGTDSIEFRFFIFNDRMHSKLVDAAVEWGGLLGRDVVISRDNSSYGAYDIRVLPKAQHDQPKYSSISLDDLGKEWTEEDELRSLGRPFEEPAQEENLGGIFTE